MEGMASCTSLSVEIPSEMSTASEADDIGRRLLNQYDIDRNGTHRSFIAYILTHH